MSARLAGLWGPGVTDGLGVGAAIRVELKIVFGVTGNGWDLRGGSKHDMWRAWRTVLRKPSAACKSSREEGSLTVGHVGLSIHPAIAFGTAIDTYCVVETRH